MKLTKLEEQALELLEQGYVYENGTLYRVDTKKEAIKLRDSMKDNLKILFS